MENIATLIQPDEQVESPETVESYETLRGSTDTLKSLIALNAIKGLQFTQGLFERND